MRRRLGLLVGLLALQAWAAEPARAASTCSLSGQYMTSASGISKSHGFLQFHGVLTFTPPADCAPGVPGLVGISVTVVHINELAPGTIQMEAEYTVEPSGRLVIGQALLDGVVALAAGDDQLSLSFVFVSDPNFIPRECRFAGVGIRTDRVVQELSPQSRS